MKAVILGLSLALCSMLLVQAGEPVAKGLRQVENIVVIYLENHSFDNLYGLFPGADGIAKAPPATTLQVDDKGRPYPWLPRVMDTREKPPKPDPRFPEKLPNRPFEIGRYVSLDHQTGDLIHRFYQHQEQINGGRMNRFAGVSDAGGLSMGYYDGHRLPLWDYARRYTLADRFFAAALGGSFLNHLWLACACTPRESSPSKENTVVLDAQGKLLKDGAFTPEGFAVNTLYSPYSPHSPKADRASHLLSPLTQPTLGDRLSERQIGWAWYAGGWNDAVAGEADRSFQFHHQPYTYFKRYADGTPERVAHLKDEEDFLIAIRRGALPAVSFYKPLGKYNEHPGYTDVLKGEEKVADILGKLEKSPQWPRMVVIVTYDEHGGYWDHVAPPKGDRWGPGTRVPALIISPFSRGGRIDHTTYDTTSILKLIEDRFGLAPLGERDAGVNSLAAALRF
ncbi:MAG: acid phosphatase [Methylococcaceae bacterium]|nr:acid phosphatase [Methylococcaceae bacterium]